MDLLPLNTISQYGERLKLLRKSHKMPSLSTKWYSNVRYTVHKHTVFHTFVFAVQNVLCDFLYCVLIDLVMEQKA